MQPPRRGWTGPARRPFCRVNGKWNDIRQGWTGYGIHTARRQAPVVPQICGTITQPRTSAPYDSPYSSNDNDKLEEMHTQPQAFCHMASSPHRLRPRRHMAHKPFCRLNPNYGVDLIKMQQTSMSRATRARDPRGERAPGVESAARDQVRSIEGGLVLGGEPGTHGAALACQTAALGAVRPGDGGQARVCSPMWQRRRHDCPGQVPRGHQVDDAEKREHGLWPAHLPGARLSHLMNSFVPFPASVHA